MRQVQARRDNRYSARVDIRVVANLRELGSKSRFDVQIGDLSLTGFGCTTTFRLSPGQVIMIALPTLAPLEATVVWAEDFRYGCRFERALHVAVFDHLVARHRATD